MDVYARFHRFVDMFEEVRCEKHGAFQDVGRLLEVQVQGVGKEQRGGGVWRTSVVFEFPKENYLRSGPSLHNYNNSGSRLTSDAFVL